MTKTEINRLSRDVDVRATFERPKRWMPAELLPEPDKEEGMSYHWVRIATLGIPDPRNFTRMLREGWEPVRVEEQPKYHLLVDHNSRFKDNIEISGLLLCKIPDDFLAQRRAYFSRQTQAQTDAVDNSFMRQSDARMPLFKEGKSSTTFGKGF